jgi:SAM-dependent methyltransferase
MNFSWDENVYAKGRMLNAYPFDIVVSFVFRHAPRGVPHSQVRVLEVGCGAGNNLWCPAREGFEVTGIDVSPIAIAAARRRFDREGLKATLLVGPFCPLPFGDDTFDLVIDRGGITCVSLTEGRRVVREVNRILKPGGRFLFNPYSAAHVSASAGVRHEDGLVHDIQKGLVEVGPICFYRHADVVDVLGEGWRLLACDHEVLDDIANGEPGSHAEWRVIVQKAEVTGKQ